MNIISKNKSQNKDEPIIVRTTRLNNLILCKGIIPAFPGNSAVSALRRSLCANENRAAGCAISSTFADAISREGLLDALLVLYNECDKDALKKRDRNISDFVNKYRPIISETRRLRINVEDFEIKALIGKGYFGTVHLVTEKATGDVYAMKTIKKPNTPSTQHKEERDIMCQRTSPWITSLQYAFQDVENLYMVMEYLPGGDLLSLMLRQRPFEELHISFYLAEMTEAINALHGMGYVHRDIKPENILIDRFGHLKLADFGNAAALNRNGNVLSMSPVGTPDYIAPELLQSISNYKLTKSLHDVSCDYWSMGIIAYEMVFDSTPFYSESVHETYSKILSYCNDCKVQEKFTYPEDTEISKELRNLIDNLITKPQDRLNYARLKAHPFFVDVDWKHLRKKVPPIIPSLNDESDLSNFDMRRKIVSEKTVQKVEESKNTNSKQVQSNDFSGQNLPFLGFTYVYLDDKESFVANTQINEMARSQKLQNQLQELQNKLQERTAEVSKLKKQQLVMERLTQQNSKQQQMMEDYKQEICKMKDLINEKTYQLARCKTTIKVLENTAKIGEENWEKNEATIAEMLRLNRRKYEEAKLNSDQYYEKQIADKNSEIKLLKEKLELRETETLSLANDNKVLMNTVKEVRSSLEMSKRETTQNMEQAIMDKSKLANKHDKELVRLREALHKAQEEIVSLKESVTQTRSQLRESENNLQAAKSAGEVAQKNYDETISRLNSEVASNIKLCHKYMQVEEQLAEIKSKVITLQAESQEYERNLQLENCKRDLILNDSHFETAPGSMSELHLTDMSEEQLRLDLEQAQKSEQSYKDRATELEAMVEKLEVMLKDMNEKIQRSNKEQDKYVVEDLLERQNEKLEDKLTAAREELVLERQSARTANLNAWKLEKQLEELRAEQKISHRRLELMEHRLKNAAAEHDSTKLKHKNTLLELKLSEERIKKLDEELLELKEEMQRERQKWSKSEEELMLNKSKVMEQFAKIRALETSVNEAQQNVHKLQAKYDEAAQEYKRVLFELKDEQLVNRTQAKEMIDLETNLRKTQRHYQQLKEACHITDTQLTEVEELLHQKQTYISEMEGTVTKLELLLRNRNDSIRELNMKCENYEETMKELRNSLEHANKLIHENEQSQQQLTEQLSSANHQHSIQHRIYLRTLNANDVLKQEAERLQQNNELREKELQVLKDENSQLLTQLYYAKEKVEALQTEIETLQATLSSQRADIEELNNVLTEKEQFYLQRNIKTDTILSQQKKLIDYLQIKVDDLTNAHKRKKTFVDRLFGVSHTSENNGNSVPAQVIESHILHRTLKAELEREKKHSSELQQQIEVLSKKEQETKKVLTPQKSNVIDQKESSKHEHKFELVTNQTKHSICIDCERMLHMRQYCWRCKECKKGMHKKCYERRGKENLQVSVEKVKMEEESETETAFSKENVEIAKQKLKNMTPLDNIMHNVFNTNMIEDSKLNPKMIIYCAYEIEDQKLLLLGTDEGLLALHIGTNPLIVTRIELGMETDIREMAVSTRIAKIIFITLTGTSLSQCDYRQLETRCRSNDSQNALESIVLDLNLSNRSHSETWQHIYISNETSNPIDSMAIAVTAHRIVLLKYDESQQFLPVRAMNTESKVSYVLFTPFTAILASDRFYEIDLESYTTEDFLEINKENDYATECHPMFVIRLSQHEFLLCFLELGIFVDEFGSRSRPADLVWQFTPTGFFYNAPFLYVSHFQSIQIIRLTKSYTQSIAMKANKDDGNKNNSELLDIEECPAIIFYEPPDVMPVIVANCANGGVYTVSVDQDTNKPIVTLVDGRRCYKPTHHMRSSLDSATSVATSLTSTTSYEDNPLGK